MEDRLYNEAMSMAVKVSYCSSSEELELYAKALYSAMVWGKTVK